MVWVNPAMDDEMVAFEADIDEDNSVYPVFTVVTMDEDTVDMVPTTDDDTFDIVLYMSFDTSFV